MRSHEFIVARRELADWSQPIVVDFLYDLYASRLGAGHHSLRVLSLSQGRMWRFVLLGENEKMAAARKEVVGLARLAGLKKIVVDEVDQAVLLELMDVIVCRFLRTPALARSYSRIVLSAATSLATAGLVAAA
jgi:hypothetical protein